MPRSNRFCLAIVSAAAIVSLAGVADAGHRRGGRPANTEPAPADKIQPIVDRATQMINCQVLRFNNEAAELIEDLAELAARVTNNTPESRILDFQSRFQEEVSEEQLKAAAKLDRVVLCATNRLTALGADPSVAAGVATASDAAQAEIDAAALALLAQLDVAVQEALAIAALPDDAGTTPGSGGCSGDDDDDDDEGDDDSSDDNSGGGNPARSGRR